MNRSVDSKPNEGVAGWPVEGIRIQPLVGMIYWYRWGDEEFDIRILRRVLGLPEEQQADKWFMAKKPNYCSAFQQLMVPIMTEARKLLEQGRHFADLIAEHDRIIDQESRRFARENEALRERQKMWPKCFKGSDAAEIEARIAGGEDLSYIDDYTVHKGTAGHQAPRQHVSSFEGDIPF